MYSAIRKEEWSAKGNIYRVKVFQSEKMLHEFLKSKPFGLPLEGWNENVSFIPTFDHDALYRLESGAFHLHKSLKPLAMR